MRYALLVRTDESAVISQEEEHRRAARSAEALDEMQADGVLLADYQLQPTEAGAAVRCWDGGDVLVTNGPLAQNKEAVMWLCIVDAKDLDAAIEMVPRIPAAWYGTVEIRPLQN